MAKSTVNQVIQRAISDAAFRRQLQRDPQRALAGFDLTKDERTAITSGDPARLTALGVDQRMSKAFGLGGIGDVSKVVVGDATGASGSAAFLDEGSSAGTGALVGSDTAAGGAAFEDLGAPMIDAGFVSSDAGSGTAAIVGDPLAGGSAIFAEPDGNVIDPGYVTPESSQAAAFEPTDASSGTQVFIEDQPADLNRMDDGGTATGGTFGVAGTESGPGPTAFEPADTSGGTQVVIPEAPGDLYEGTVDADLGTAAPEAVDDASGGLDTTGGGLRPSEY